MGIEAKRNTEFHCALGPDVLMVRNFTGSERLGAPFEYQVTLYSKDHNLKLESLLGQHASVEVRFELKKPRFFDGIVCDFSHQGFFDDFAVYSVTLRPWLWLLSRNRDCRIFQDKTTLEIAREIFSEQGFSDLESRLLMALQPREYCVQYNESDLQFISRLFEHEGIYYYFKHEQGKHTLVLADGASAHDPVPGYETVAYKHLDKSDAPDLGFIDSWRVTKQILPGKVTLNDYDFEKPRANLEAQHEHTQQHEHADANVYQYPGHYTDPAVGADQATLRLEQAQVAYEIAHGSTHAKWLSSGALFTLEKHPRDDQNREYLIASASYDVDAGSFSSTGGSTARMSTRFSALSSQVTFRPRRSTAVPFVSGPQTAVVVGPKGEEHWIDKYGRIKVQFAWDHRGKRDEKSSCFIRVSQGWAGPGWGAVHWPRIGQEVLVEFMDGDLDRPIVTGRVYNAENMPPYELAKHAARSGVKSATLKGDTSQFNELYFDDTKGSEEIKLRAQRNLNLLVRANSTSSVGNNHTHTVKKDMKVHVKEGNLNHTVSKGWLLNYVPDSTFDVLAKEIVQTADEAITFEVKDVKFRMDSKSLSLSVGSTTSIKLDLATLTIIGPKVDINPMGAISQPPPSVTSKAETAGKPDKDPGEEEFKGGGGSFGGAGASGDF